ncbi:hypothetical protein [Desulfocurvus sp. DL9XJH121]
MEQEIHVLVLEAERSAGFRISDALKAAGARVHMVDSCARAMNKMLEYMDLVVVDSRAQGQTSQSVECIKRRLATTCVAAVAGEDELRSLRFQGRVRADAYVPLGRDGQALAAALLDILARSPRRSNARFAA